VRLKGKGQLDPTFIEMMFLAFDRSSKNLLGKNVSAPGNINDFSRDFSEFSACASLI